MSMAFSVRRAFHITSASWLLICGIGTGAMPQDAAPSSAPQLPGITVTAPRTPVRVARTVPGRDRAPTPTPQPQPAPAQAAAAPEQGVLPIVTDQFATVT